MADPLGPPSTLEPDLPSGTGRSAADGPLAGQHAVVTGGGRGIGAAIAEELGRLGASLTLIGRSAASLEAARSRLEAETSRTVNVAVADVADEAAVREAFVVAGSTFGRPTILVNNAGAARSAPFVDTDLGLWQAMLEVNLTGAYLCTQQALPDMVSAGYGRIVNVASTAGLIGYAYVTAYCAAKHGLVGLTRALALETARSGVTVNAVCPGFTDTDLTAEAVALIGHKTGRGPERARAELERRNPLGRLIRPEEVAQTVGWLVLPGSRAITGQSIVVAGGEVT